MSATTANDVYYFCLREPFYESILHKYIRDKEKRDEFHQHLWLILLEMNNKIVTSWNERWFKYLYLRVIKNQIISNRSDWHVYFRDKIIEHNDDAMAMIDDKHEDNMIELNSNLAKECIKKHIGQSGEYKRDFELLKMKAKGMTYREISDKTNIPLGSVYKYVQTASMFIKNYINKNSE